MIVTRTEFKGHPMLTFKKTEDDKWPINLGYSKVQAVLENLEAARAFVAEVGERKEAMTAEKRATELAKLQKAAAKLGITLA